ncbi:MAG TPA: glycoside hydrolase family 127 protein, partial [Actinopolymorphaceae bacterium]
PADFTLYLPVPGWATDVTVRLGDEIVEPERRDGYLALTRTWRAGDTVRLDFAFEVRQLAAHPRIAPEHQRIALARGPLVYCLEQADQRDVDVEEIRLRGTERWTASFDPELLGGLVTLTANAAAVEPDDGPLYRPYVPGPQASREVEVTAIPYYAWANREPGAMRVFVPVDPS